MELKILVLTATLAVVHGGIVGPIGSPPQASAIPVGVPALQTRIEPIDPHPRYAYGYDVNDYITGDSKNHQEVRDGDVVRGVYSLSDSDGTRRIVTYNADPLTGFNAIVQKTPLQPRPGPGPIGLP
ncbi:larval cuticle protein A2B-like [Agrilus planipennis]|uniref:Larval cuticle protein A2B-like n=1 Tax=Agrilus planipennis TaxID=224129 RepID=A0A1W4WXQ8_AGRPL|nr:larval cuticle protein A2B-like [Agrilus planipennis]